VVFMEITPEAVVVVVTVVALVVPTTTRPAMAVAAVVPIIRVPTRAIVLAWELGRAMSPLINSKFSFRNSLFIK
jgi:hypothetical protein